MSDSTSNDNKALVKRFVEIINAQDFERLDEIVQRDVRRHSQSTPDVKVESLDELKQFLARDQVAFPDARIELLQLVSEGPFVAHLSRFTGTQEGPMGPFPASGKAASIDCSGLFRIEGGRIAELWIVWDNLAVLGQLGHLPSPEPPT
jgi:steroid delta-isomerase-like uncharacterized protein